MGISLSIDPKVNDDFTSFGKVRGTKTFPNWIYDGSVIPDPLGYGDRAVRFLKALILRSLASFRKDSHEVIFCERTA